MLAVLFGAAVLSAPPPPKPEGNEAGWITLVTVAKGERAADPQKPNIVYFRPDGTELKTVDVPDS
jgi:hypothetical protein